MAGRRRPVRAGSPRGSANTAEHELRRVSVLFADIEGSTSLIQHLDPEETAALLDPPLQAMRAAVERFDGAVCHLGDGILAVFGAPSACEDHAVRSCLAALAIRDACAQIGSPVRVRIGIHTGDVVMRERRVGRAQLWEPVGPALHVAARLEKSAEPGTICISASTHEQARGFVETAVLPPAQAKGIDEPVERFAVLSADTVASRWTVRAAHGLAEMVDRLEERASLRRLLEGGAGQGLRWVQVIGEPGIGKSRLLHETLQSAEPVWAVNHLTGDPHRRDVAFHAFGVWLRSWLDVRASDAPQTVRQRLIERLSRLGQTDAQAGEALARLLGVWAEPPAPGELTTHAPSDAVAWIADLVLRLAGPRRVVLACEDVDCFDPASRDLLTTLMDVLAQRDVLVLSTSRTRTRLRAGPPTQSITLAPLSGDDTLRLLFQIDPALAASPAWADALQRKTGGNPLFVEEVGALAARKRPAAGAEDHDLVLIELPDRVESLIADRLNRLPRASRRLAQVCAVLGGIVPLRLLSRVMNVAEAELHPQLLRLQQEQVLSETRRYPDAEFVFRHALTRETAYQMILAARRRELHGRTMEALEAEGAAGSPSRLDDLCFHAVGAQSWDKAAHYLHLAAQLAAEKSAFMLARLRLDQALDASRKLPDDERTAEGRLAMLLDLRVLQGAAGAYAQIGPTLDEAEGLAHRVGDRNALARIMAQRVHLMNLLGRLQEAMSLGRDACEAARGSNDRALQVLASHHLAQAYFNHGDLRACDEVLSAVVPLLADIRDRNRPGTTGSLSVLVHFTRMMGLAMQGDQASAAASARMVREEAERTERPYDLAYAQLAEGIANLSRAPAVAAGAFHEGISICSAGQIAQVLPPLQAGLGHALLLSGQWDEAGLWLAQARSGSSAQTRSMVQGWATGGLALALAGVGDRQQALALADEAVDIAIRGGFRPYQVIALRTRAEVRGGAEAADDYRAALALATELGMRGEAEACRAALTPLRRDQLSSSLSQ